MRYPLTADVVKRLKIESKPVGVDSQGKIIYEPNPDKKEYFVFCANQDSPKGFGVRLTAGSGRKTWILQRRAGSKVVRAKIGDCAEWPIEEARRKAASMAREIKETGLNPNETAKRVAAGEITIGGAMSSYKHHLKTRANKTAKPNTITNFERAERRFMEVGWWERRIRDIPTQEIMATFELKMKTAPTANEQNFNWLSRAIRHVLDQEVLDAAATGRPQTLSANPIKILHLKGMYRAPEEVEAARQTNNSRNPLGPRTTLGPFLEAMWSRRGVNRNDVGPYFCIVELAVGARRGELSRVRWGETLTAEERSKGETSYVWLEEGGEYGPHVYFDPGSTKNRRAHRVPMGPLLANMLRRRRDEEAEETERVGFGRKGRQWVFPARNTMSKTGVYHDPSYLLDAVATEIGVAFLNPHDLRRTMGSVMMELQVPGGIQSRLLNHTAATSKEEAAAAVTARYTTPEWELLRRWAERVQDFVFRSAPNLFNDCRPLDVEPMAAPERHVPTPPKKRPGRPKKLMVDSE